MADERSHKGQTVERTSPGYRAPTAPQKNARTIAKICARRAEKDRGGACVMLNNGEQRDVRVATVGVSVSLNGEIKGSEDVMVEGQVQGRIDLPDHTLTNGPNA